MRVAIAILLSAAAAQADPLPDPPPPPREAYRWAIVGGDAAGALFTFGFGALAYHERNCTCEDFSGEGVLLGLGIYLGIGAVVHADAGHTDRAVESFAIRAALPIAAGVGAHAAGASGAGSLLAAGGGMAAAMGIDWFLLAEASRPVKPKTAFYITPAAGGVVAGLGGTLP